MISDLVHKSLAYYKENIRQLKIDDWCSYPNKEPMISLQLSFSTITLMKLKKVVKSMYHNIHHRKTFYYTWILSIFPIDLRTKTITSSLPYIKIHITR